ncbi:MAG: hypothetical protein ACKVP0_06780 [Pirellulaceae bacterium]
MPKYEVEQYELHVMKYRIEAANEAEAVAKLLDGEAESVDGSLEYVEVAEDSGLPVDECQDLADKLREVGVPVGEHIIPSIRSIKELV